MHNYIIGQSRTGKSTLLHDSILKDIEAGHGVAVFDPHGTLIDTVLSHFPKRRLKDAIVFDPSDIKHPIAWNPLYKIPHDSRPLFARAIQSTFRDVWDYDRVPTPDIDLAVYNSARALMDVPDGTLLGLFHMIVDEPYRKTVIGHIKDPVIRRYYQYFAGYSDKDQRDKERSTLNKIEILLADPFVRNVLGQPVSSFSLQDVLETNKCLFVRLPQGVLGVDGTKAIGSLLLTSLHHEALRRKSRRHFGVYLDECHTFGAHTLSEMLSGIGKFGVELTLAHQYLSQLPEKLKSSILGNASNLYIFRTGMEDSAELLETIGDSQNALRPHKIERYTARFFADGEELENLLVEPIAPGEPYDDLIKASRATYASRRDHVENHIAKFLENVPPKKRAKRGASK